MLDREGLIPYPAQESGKYHPYEELRPLERWFVAAFRSNFSFGGPSMFQRSRTFNVLVTLFVAAGLVFTCLQAESKPGKSRPFKADGVAVWDNVFAGFGGEALFVGSGNGTHLGKFQQEGNLTFTAAPEDGIAPGIGEVTLTAANGDELRFEYIGELNAATGVGEGTLEFTGGTGRFAGATGSGEFYAEIDLSAGPELAPMKVWLTGSVKY